MKKSIAAQAIRATLVASLAFGGVQAAVVPMAFAEDALEASEAATATLTFSNDGITGAGNGCEASGTTLTITSAGRYVVSGSCSDGQIEVKKGVQNVTIVLNGLTLFKAGSSGTIELVGTNTLSTSNDKGIIKANAEADDSGNIVYGAGGTTTGGDLTVTGSGTLNLSSTYTATVDGEEEGCDAINCEGDLTVLSGTFNISVTDDALHADNTLTIGSAGTAGPTINVTKATEGLEGATVRLLSGTGDLLTIDDGVNAANADLASLGWQYGIEVAGGTWKVVSGGDGLDSNGSITVSGGTTEVYSTGSGNGALDIGEGAEGEIRGTFDITGGTLFAVGTDMPITPNSGNYVTFGNMGMGGMPGGAAGGQQPGGMPGGQQGGMPGGPQQGGQPMQPGQGGGFQPMGDQQPSQGVEAPGAQVQPDVAIVAAGQQTSVTAAGQTLFSTTAAASGSYALFSAAGMSTDATYTLTSGSTQTQGAVNGSAATSGATTMYRLYNPYSGEHFYTSGTAERDNLVRVGWKDEGVGWTAPRSSNTPVYRLYNPYSGDHHYTTGAGERDAMVATGWVDEGIGWYSDDAQGVPLYRQFNPYETVGTHNYTTSKEENDALVKLGWRAEGVAWYGVKA